MYSPNGQQIASGSRDKTVRLWDAQTGIPGPVLSGHTDCVESVVYSPNGQQIASCSNDTTVRLWDAQTGVPGPVLSGHTDYVNSVVYSPNGQQIASGSEDRTVRLWDVDSSQCLLVMDEFQGWVMSIAWKETSNGTYFVTGCEDKSVRKWQVVEKDGHTRVNLNWSSCHDRLVLKGISVEGERDLSNINKQLLRQRGAICSNWVTEE